MTNRRKTHDGYYVTARLSDGRTTGRTAWLIGPFDTLPQAMRMVRAGANAANRTDDPRFAFAAFGTAKMTLPIDKPLPPGRLDLSLINPNDVIFGAMKS